MKGRLLLIIPVISILFILNGCGGSGPGSPGSEGFENIGAKIDITNASHTDPAGDQGDMWQIDLTADICDPGPPPEYELWGDDYAVLDFEATSYNLSYPAGMLYIQRYKVEYTPQYFEFGLPAARQYDLTSSLAIKPDTRVVTGTLLVLKAGDKTEIADLLYQGIFIPPTFPMLYDMKITFYGQDEFGNNFSFTWHRTVSIGYYYKC